jgi:hydrogenase maturation protease
VSGGRLLVAGIGNVFFGDDGFGVEVVRRLAALPRLPGVDVADFGIRGLDLAYALGDGYDAAILVDAMPRGGAPGTLYVVDPDVARAPAMLSDTHGLEPRKMLDLVRTMDASARLPVLRVLGCEPSPAAGDEMTMDLSAPVAAAVDGALALIASLVVELREGVTRGA